MPERGAFAAWRQVGTDRILAGKAEAHRHYRDTALVVEGLAVDAHPVAQAIARPVGEGDAALVDAGSRRLAGKAERGGRGGAQHRPRLVRQGGGANRRVAAQAAGADAGEDVVQAWR